MDTRLHFSSATDQHPTPQAFFERVNRRYGPFEVDVCADAKNATCDRFFSAINHVVGKPHLKIAPMEMKADNDEVPFGLQLPHHSNQMKQIAWVQLIGGSDFKTPDRGDTSFIVRPVGTPLPCSVFAASRSARNHSVSPG